MILIRAFCSYTWFKPGLAVLFIHITITGFSQSVSNREADSLYHVKKFVEAGRYYLKAVDESEFKRKKNGMYYNAACCYALAGKQDSALLLLKISFDKSHVNIENLVADSDLQSLHDLPRWKELLSSLKPVESSTTDPGKVQLMTTDVDNFWKAYDLAQKDSASRLEIYKQHYVDAGSVGLQDYFALKVRNMKSFVATHDKLSKFYSAIRKNTLTIEKQKPQMLANFRKFKEFYPAAVFSNVYFIIGAFTSGGTVSESGMLIGLDQSAATPDIPTGELSLWQKNNFTPVADMPHLIAHELIHFNQAGLASDTSLLRAVLVEGMADFLGQLISGKTANERLHVWARGKEKQIWAEFRKEMYLNKSRNWIANSDQETADKPADLGYWIGFQICKAYYENSADKKQAVHDILNIKNYKDFYEKGGAAKLYK